MKEFDKIQGSHGTRIILFNLRKRENEESHLYELDFALGMISASLTTQQKIRHKASRPGLSTKSRRSTRDDRRSRRLLHEGLYGDSLFASSMRVLLARREDCSSLSNLSIGRKRILRLFPEYKPKGFADGVTVHCGYVVKETPSCAASTFTTKIV